MLLIPSYHQLFILVNHLTFCWLTVWEVRHGSIMALREILTYQGAYAGVYFPDPSLERPIAEVDGKNYLGVIKRSREIDLNEQFAADEYESDLKRQKFADDSNPYEIKASSLDKELSNGCYTNVEAGPRESTQTFVNEVPNSACVKAELDLCNNGSTPSCKIEDLSSSSLSAGFLASLPQNSKLMKLIKLGRLSWIKNWEFLQDCAIRFLCVLSLDRYVHSKVWCG